MARRTLYITYITIYLLTVGGIIRYVVRFRDYRVSSIALLMGYLILLFAEPVFIRRHRRLVPIYLLVQTAIICTVSLISPTVDFWTTLFLPLVVQVMLNYPQRTGSVITGIFTVIMAILMLLGPGPEVGLPLIFLNAVGYFLFAAFIAIIREAEAAREESQQQQAELQQEVKQRAQVEEALRQSEMEKAVAAERNRLARELHDSVTQSLYSLTLFTEAARHGAQDAGYEGIERQIGQIGRIGLQALKEMRLLVYELRPPELEQEGLIRALRQRLEAVEGRAGVEARVVVDADDFGMLPPGVELGFYRIAQEALNNSLKHAAATSVVVHLRKEANQVELEIVDDGLGFDPEAIRDRGGVGLESIRILVADDHELVRQGFAALLSVKPDVEVVGQAADGNEAVELARALQPDVILLDLVMPRMGGIKATKAIKSENPKARILIITSFAEDDNVYRAVQAGALGYLLKDSSPQALMRAIHDVYEGRLSLHPNIALKLMEELNRPSDRPPTEDPLTEREVEVLKLVAKGLSNQEIAEKLVVSERTVGAHVSNILGKLHLANRTQAALYALRTGLSDLTPG